MFWQIERMAAINTSEDFSERIFEQDWVIPNWENVRPSEALLKNTNIEIQCKADNLEYAKFIVGFKVSTHNQDQDGRVNFYWELICKHFCLHYVEANLLIEMFNSADQIGRSYKSQAKAVIGYPMDIKSNWNFPYRGTSDDILSWTNPEGSMVIKLTLTLTDLPNRSYFSKANELLQASRDELQQNLAALLDDESSSDVKILTKDQFELFAHKTVLRARCPVFATMFGSDFQESNTGMVKIEDISAKLMKILLKYWYSGELLPAWKNSDIVVEFVYAAGKYQMANVLKMLDDDYSGLNFQASDLQLLTMVNNLCLENAEDKILKRIVQKVNQVKTGTDLLELFNLATDNPNDESFKASEILKVFEDVLSKQNDNDTCTRDIKLMAWAGKLGLKTVEDQLLARIIDRVKKVISADELFQLVVPQYYEEGDDVTTNDLREGSSSK